MPDSEGKNREKGVSRVLFVIIAAIIFIIIVVMVLLFPWKEIKEEKIDKSLDDYSKSIMPQLTLNITFCRFIDADMNCEPSYSNIYRRGESVLFLVKSINLESVRQGNKSYFDFIELVETYGPDGLLIEQDSGEVFSGKYESKFSGYLLLPIKNELLTNAEYTPGEYRVVVTIIDNNNEKEVVEELFFELLE